MSIVFLAIGTVLSILFIVLLAKGSRHDYMIEPLDSEAFPMKFLYSVGFALQDIKAARLRGKWGNKLREETTLYYGKQYGEFYARAVWAQSLSFALACTAFMFLISGLFSGETSAFFVVVGILLAVIAAYYFMTYTRNKLNARRDECENEFPNAISKLALLVNSGVILHEAWRMVAFGKEGRIYEMMRDACGKMENGASEIDAIYEFGVISNSSDIKKFASALIQSLERGGGELPIFLANQSSELWAQRRQRLLQKGEKAASALLMPISLMFFGVMLIVIAAAMQSFSL